MTKTLLRLESYDLAKYAEQAPCYICGGGNAFDAEYCRHCQAPMALAHQVNSQGLRPQLLACIGASGAGKTVFLGMLCDLLSRGDHPLQLLARGAFSISLQQSTMQALARCEFPAKTPLEPDHWNWMHCQLQDQQTYGALELIMPDMAGEAIVEEMEHPGAFPVIKAFLSHCRGLVVLIDAARIEEGDQEHDFFTMKMLSYLTELNGDPGQGWPARPLALVFAKADLTDACFDDPREYARRHTPGLLRHCDQRFARAEFFASGVAGACAWRREANGDRTCFPLRIEPRGIVEPFAWLIDQVQHV